ncbi:hypothetical protein OTB20_23480 [Streptomyces sp. H27-H1]|uniref:hypothetical protein n=1 Tax=Streptomyces sp. H27-H1 TaxID=2996461 RepID=UPI0022722A7B|nr:hypothetical protein [Streptomyces sp. H27-H1]MCY0929103.1 hypothetical protein [Streptomyces sp. H27-H1]
MPDTSEADKFDMLDGFGFSAAVLVSALINAAAIWALLRYVTRRRGAGSAQV